MIKVKYTENYSSLKITGHADYAPHGSDIVCASVSSIITTSVNLALRYDNNIKYTDKEGLVEISNQSSDENIIKIFENMIYMLKELEEQYPKNIKVSKGE